MSNHHCSICHQNIGFLRKTCVGIIKQEKKKCELQKADRFSGLNLFPSISHEIFVQDSESRVPLSRVNTVTGTIADTWRLGKVAFIST